MSTTAPRATNASSGQQTREVREAVVVRFAGDSGDGMQLTGSQFTLETALAGLDLTTFPDYPAEIRAPVGTTFGVSAFQIHFGSVDVKTAGDEVDVLVIVADTGSFGERNLAKAGYDTNPLQDDTLAPYQVIPLDITQLTMNAVDGFGLSKKEALRCRNMWALGLMLWMYDRDLTATAAWLTKKFAARETLAQSNNAALKAGHAYGETAELSGNLVGYRVKDADLPPGEYRTINGTEALVWGLISGLRSAGLERLVFGSYPITPASPVLHALATMREQGVYTFQAEDEIAAICAAIGASYGAHWVSHRRRAPALRSRRKRSAWRSALSCPW